MRFALVASASLLVLLWLELFLQGGVQPARAQSVCHDGSWDAGEFCGRDAYLATGRGEMNHDCVLDALDVSLMNDDFARIGSNLSGDLNGNGVVNTVDVGILINDLKAGDTDVSPCTPGGMRPDPCEGTIALSFGANPELIVSTIQQGAGYGTLYVVVDGWTGAAMLEYGIETSSNLSITTHQSDNDGGAFSSQAWCDPDPQHSLRLFFAAGSSPWPAGPLSMAELDYELLDANPAWLKLVPLPSCYPGSRIRWAEAEADRSFDFATVLHAGINGPAPAAESTCTAALSVPSLSPLGVYLLGGVLWTAGALRSLRRRRSAG